MIDLLARLAEIDPGGRMRNRPLSSLATIFCPQHPGISLPAQRHMAVIDAMRQRHPGIAWRLMIALLPAQIALCDRTPEPRVPRLEAAGTGCRGGARPSRWRWLRSRWLCASRAAAIGVAVLHRSVTGWGKEFHHRAFAQVVAGAGFEPT